MNATGLGCRHTPATTNDAAATDGNAETVTIGDAGVSDGLAEADSATVAGYVRTTCTPLDPVPGPLLDDVECGLFTVKAEPGSGRAVLPVLRLSPHTVDKQADPVIVLAGGPGQSAVPLLRDLFLERPFLGLLSQRDVIAIGFRGTEGSEPDLACAEASGKDFSSREVTGGAADSVYAACRDRLSSKAGSLAQFGSRQNAADVVALVATMGIAEWNVYGFSYGTRTAVELAGLKPKGLRAIVLDSAVPGHTPLISEAILRGNEVLARVLADCEKEPSCKAAFPNLSERLLSLVDRLATAPVRRRLAGGVDITIDDSQLLAILQALLSFRAGAEQIPLVIDAMDSDISQFDELLQAMVAANGAVATGVYLSVTCGEVPAGDIEPTSLMDPFLSGLAKASHASAAMKRLCGIWGVPYAEGAQAASSDIPTLILTGELDPAIRPEWAARVAAGRAAAQAFTIPGEAHTPGDSLCGARVVATFMESPTQQVVQPCLTEPRPLRFATP